MSFAKNKTLPERFNEVGDMFITYFTKMTSPFIEARDIFTPRYSYIITNQKKNGQLFCALDCC